MGRSLTAILVACLLGSTSDALASDVPVQEKGLLSGDSLVARAWNSQTDVAGATGGTLQLVVWSDYRAQNAGSSTNQSEGDIYGIRIDSTGTPVDRVPFAITMAPGEQRYPTVAWNGENWLVVYRSQDPVDQYFANRIRAVRVSPAGEVLDSTPLLFETSDLPFRAAGTANQWLVTYTVYREGGYGTMLVGKRVSGDGEILDPQPRVLLDWSYGAITVLGSGAEYLVAGADWSNSALFRARRIGLNGTPLGNEFTVPSLNLGAHDGTFFIAWTRNFTELVGSRMLGDGSLLDPDGRLLTTDYSQYHQCSIGHGGDQWWIAWGAANFAHTVRVTDQGDVLDVGGGPQLPVGGGSGFLYGAQIHGRADGGANFYWSDGRQGESDVWCIPISSGNVAADERCASTGTAAQLLPDLAGGPAGRSAITYVSRHAADHRVLVHLLTPSGDPIHSEPTEIMRGPNIGQASIAWNGSCYLVVWDEGAVGMTPTQIMGRRINPDGSFIDAQPIVIMPGYSPNIEALGDNFLVACSRFASNPQFIYAQARRINGNSGALLDANPIVLLVGYVSTGPRVRSDGARWIVTYHSHWSHNSSQSDVVYNFVNADGTFTPARNPATTSGGAGTPDVAFAAGRYLFVWRSNTLGQPNSFITGRLMNADGIFAGDPFVIAEAPGRQLRPVIDWSGAEFVVAWEDQRHQLHFFDARTDVYAARVTVDGDVLDPNGIPLVTNPNGDCGATIVGQPSGRVLVASARLTTDAMFASYRVGLTIIGAEQLTADLTGLTMLTGTVTSGTVNDLRLSDDVVLQTRSGFGRTFTDLHHMEMVVHANSTRANPAMLDVKVESRISHTAGTARLRLRNWALNRYDVIAIYAVGQTENVWLVEGLDATKYIDADGDIDLAIRHVVVVPVFAFNFSSFLDQVEMEVR